MDYFDILLAKKLSGGGGGGEITVEGLTVNDNGTYIAPSGKAYSPVVVNLPLDEKTITANGEYLASADDLKGYSKVTVNVEGFKIKDMPTGAISSFDDGTENPLKELKVSIVPVQSGSGDPSHSNPRPISGWSSVGVTVDGKNLYNISNGLMYGSYSNYNLAVGATLNLSNTAQHVTVSITNDVISVTNNINWRGIAFVSPKLKAGITYRRMYSFSTDNVSNTKNTMYLVDDDFKIVSTVDRYSSMSNQDYNFTFTTPTDGLRFVECIEASTQFTYSITKYMICISSQASIVSDFEPYNGTTTTIPLGQTVYGGILDVTNGELKPYKYYASYNGETLVGEWMSSMDVYSSGTTPTTGAQVVDFGAFDTTITLTPTQITTLLGQNNIWADSGEVLEGEYFISL